MSDYRPDRAGSAQQISSSQQAAANAAAAAAQAAQRKALEQAVQQEEQAREQAALDYRYTGSPNRTSWELTTKRREYMRGKNKESRDYEPLLFNVNPASYQFDNPFRQQVVQAKGGPVIHTFRDPNRNYTNFGFGTMNIEMSSGSLMPRATKYGEEGATNQQWKMSPNVGNFYKWLEIIQEDTVYEVTDENGNKTVEPNYQIITMSTLLFPRITLYGYFITNANWSEQAENPAEVQNWQTQFIVYETSPSLTGQKLNDLYSQYEKEFNEQHFNQMRL